MGELQRGEIAWPLPGANGVGKWHTCDTGQRKLVEISFRDNGLLIRRGGQHQQEKVRFPSLGAKCLAVVAETNRRFQREGEGQKCPMLQMRLPQGIQLNSGAMIGPAVLREAFYKRFPETAPGG